MNTKTINSFQGGYRFLSNFYAACVVYDGQMYPTVEHAYQAAKTFDREQRAVIRSAIKPGDAKRLGRQVTIRPDWDKVKVEIMLNLLRQKFNIVTFRSWLLMTGDDILIEGNTWNDTFWGVCKDKGQNMLGNLIMQVRKELRDELY